MHIEQFVVWGAISLSASKRKRGRYAKGHIDAGPTVFIASVLYVTWGCSKTLDVHVSAKSRNDVHVRWPCDQDRNEQERYQNIYEIKIARFAQQAPPIYSSSMLRIFVSGGP